MARCDTVDFPFVMQSTGKPFDLGIGSFHQMEASEQHMYVRIHGSGGAQDFFHTWMRTSGNKNEPMRSVQRQRKLAEFQSSLHVRDRRNKKNAGSNFYLAIDRYKVRFRPRTPGGKRFRFRSIEIPHVARESIHGLVKSFRKSASKDTKRLRWGVDFDPGIDLEQIIQPARMISVPVRNHDKIQVFQINVHGFDIGGKYFCVAAGIKKDLLP